MNTDFAHREEIISLLGAAEFDWVDTMNHPAIDYAIDCTRGTWGEYGSVLPDDVLAAVRRYKERGRR